MNDKFTTLAIHKNEKANILKQILESNGIEVEFEVVLQGQLPNESSIAVRIKESDLSRALSIIEANQLFNYSDKHIQKIDDGRKRILVAVDFSDYSVKACQMAFNIAKEINAKVKILHVFHNIYFPSNIPFADSLKDIPDEGLLDKTRKQMLELCIDIDKKIAEGIFPSINYSYSLREGLAGEEIEQFINEYKPVLLVLGTKGKDNNKKYMLGGVTADIIEMTNIPVLAIPESSPINNICDVKHIAFLTNLHARDLASFKTLVSLVSPYQNIKITLVHINRINKEGGKCPEASLVEMREHFLKQYPQFNIAYKLIDAPDIPNAIENFAIEEDVTVVALNTRRRNIFGRMFVPSISRKVLLISKVTLLVLRG